MEAYIQAAQQVRDDLTEMYYSSVAGASEDDLKDVKGNPRKVLDNVEIVFRNSAKQRLFSQRIRKIPKTKLEDDDLVAAYMCTDDEETYNDALNAISCCKKISYLLFTCRYNFGIGERNKYQDSLRKQERLCPEKNIEIYNIKKQIVDLMETGPATYAAVQPLVSNMLGALNILLHSQMSIYQTEKELNQRFSEYLSAVLDPGSSYSKAASEPATLKGIVAAFTAQRQRGMDIPEFKSSIKTDDIATVNEEIKSHVDILAVETENLQLVTQFLDVLIKYIETAAQRENREKKEAEKGHADESGFFESIKDGLSNTLQEWLNRK